MLGSSTGDGTVPETPSGTEKGLENAGAGAATVTATADTEAEAGRLVHTAVAARGRGIPTVREMRTVRGTPNGQETPIACGTPIGLETPIVRGTQSVPGSLIVRGTTSVPGTQSVLGNPNERGIPIGRGNRIATATGAVPNAGTWNDLAIDLASDFASSPATRGLCPEENALVHRLNGITIGDFVGLGNDPGSWGQFILGLKSGFHLCRLVQLWSGCYPC